MAGFYQLNKYQRANLIFTIIIAFITIIGVEAGLSQLMVMTGRSFKTILTINLIYWVVLTFLFLVLVEAYKYEK